MTSDLRRVLWLSEVRGSRFQGFVRVQVFIDPETQETRLEVEYSDRLGGVWSQMPHLG